MTCPEHLSPSSGLSHCLACANSNSNPDPKAAPNINKNTNASRPKADRASTYDSDESYRYRQSYYRDNNYDPSPSSFDRSDARAFAAGLAVAAADHDDEMSGASFGDS